MNKSQILVSLAIICSLAIQAQSNLKTKSVSIFKNGSAFFLKEGQITPIDGSHFLAGGVPPATFGTFLFSSTTGAIKQVRTHTQTELRIKKQVDTFKSSSFQSMLEANIGQKITLHLNSGEAINGVIEKVDQPFLLVRSGEKWVNLNIQSVARIDFASAPLSPDKTTTRFDTTEIDQEGLLIDFDSKASQQQLEVMYLRPDIGWIPTYKFNLLDSNKAKLTLQAMVINHAEDLEDTEVNFVVGVPNFLYRNQTSPLAESVSFNRLLNRNKGASLDNSDFRSRGSRSDVVTYEYQIDQPIQKGFDDAPTLNSLKGTSTEDLFFYTLPHVTMEEETTAIFNILEAEIPIRHLYEVRLNANKVSPYGVNRHKGGGFSFEENFKNKVWHTLKINNPTNTPFTEGAVTVTTLFEDNVRPVSQDKINYTPAGGESFLKLTVAPDISVRDAEEVLSIQEKHSKIGKDHYDLVSVKGTIKIHNYKNKDIYLNIRRNLVGGLVSSKPKWLKAPRIPEPGQINEVTDVCWELNLKSGAKKEVSYQYTMLVKSK